MNPPYPDRYADLYAMQEGTIVVKEIHNLGENYEEIIHNIVYLSSIGKCVICTDENFSIMPADEMLELIHNSYGQIKVQDRIVLEGAKAIPVE